MICSPRSPVKKENNSSARAGCTQNADKPGRTNLMKSPAVPRIPEIRENTRGTNLKNYLLCPAASREGEQISRIICCAQRFTKEGGHISKNTLLCPTAWVSG